MAATSGIDAKALPDNSNYNHSGSDSPVDPAPAYSLDKEKGGVNTPVSGEAPFYTPAEEKALLRKIDLRLLPPLTLLYLLSFLDRSNVANARLEGLVQDLHISPDQYLTGLTLYFIGYVLFEIPCNIILKKTSPRAWLPTLAILWGIIATVLGATQNLGGFWAVRFLLGAAESGLFPGIVFYFSMWYKRSEQHFRVALFFSAASLAGAFGGILAYGIAFMRGVGGLNGWRWIFILEGLLTVVVGFLAYFFIENYPQTAKFLKPHEREVVLHRLSRSSDATEEEAFNWAGVRSALADPKCWLYGFTFHTLSLPLYTLSLFLPTIIVQLGYTAAQAQLLSVPPYAIATILTVVNAILSQRYKRRAIFIIVPSIVGIIGYIILLTVPSNVSAPGAYVGTILAAAGIYPACAIALSWPANNVSGQSKRATACAMQISIGNLGAVIGTQLYRSSWAPRFFVGHGVACAYLVGNIAVVSLLWLVLKRENDRRDRIVAAGNEAAGIGASHDGKDLTDAIRDGEVGVKDVEAWRGDESVSWRFQT